MASEEYDSVVVEIDCGVATIRTEMNGKVSRIEHEEDVSDWSDDDLKELAANYTCCKVSEVTVEYS